MPYPIQGPALAVPIGAVAYGALDEPATLVTSETPLPVKIIPSASANPLAGQTAQSQVVGPFSPTLGTPIRLTLTGNWAGKVTVKRSIDGGASKHPLTLAGESWGVFTGNVNELVTVESESGAQYYLDAALVSGTLAYRVSQ